MEIKKITDDFFVTAQVRPEQMDDVVANGFRSILCNRPDNEEAGQPSFEAVQAAAKSVGIEMRHVPIVHGAVGPADFSAFSEALAALPGPVLAYCKTGGRSAKMYEAVSQNPG